MQPFVAEPVLEGVVPRRPDAQSLQEVRKLARVLLAQQPAVGPGGVFEDVDPDAPDVQPHHLLIGLDERDRKPGQLALERAQRGSQALAALLLVATAPEQVLQLGARLGAVARQRQHREQRPQEAAPRGPIPPLRVEEAHRTEQEQAGDMARRVELARLWLDQDQTPKSRRK